FLKRSRRLPWPCCWPCWWCPPDCWRWWPLSCPPCWRSPPSCCCCCSPPLRCACCACGACCGAAACAWPAEGSAACVGARGASTGSSACTGFAGAGGGVVPAVAGAAAAVEASAAALVARGLRTRFTAGSPESAGVPVSEGLCDKCGTSLAASALCGRHENGTEGVLQKGRRGKPAPGFTEGRTLGDRPHA